MHTPNGTGNGGGASFKVRTTDGLIIAEGSASNSRPELSRSYITPAVSYIPAGGFTYVDVTGASTYNSQKFWIELIYDE